MELQTLQIQKNKDQIKINTIEGEIEEIESYQHKSAMVRSRTKLIENEEKPTKFFYAADRIPMEFYITFWHLIKNDFTKLVNHIFFLKEELTESRKTAIISMIPKKDPNYPDIAK